MSDISTVITNHADFMVAQVVQEFPAMSIDEALDTAWADAGHAVNVFRIEGVMDMARGYEQVQAELTARINAHDEVAA